MSDFAVRRAVVIGAGTMGSGIAAHFANAGIPVYLLDVIEPPLDKIKKHTPPPFFTAAAADLVTAGKLDDHEAWIGEGDWIVEAIVETMDAKRDLVARIDRLRKPDSIVSSNTSGLPIARIAADASENFKQHFIGTHFFNPPRYMKLLEVIPTRDTAPEITNFVRHFAEHRLGKGVVLCKDTPNFIANRLASVGGMSLNDFVLANDYTIEEADAIAGPLIGRPKTAAFRLQDLVGLDVACAVAANLYGLIPGDESREILRSERFEALRKAQVEKGRLGDKTKQGFYKKDGKTILTLDLKTGEYRQRIEPGIPSLAEAATISDLGERLKFVLRQDDKAGALARHAVYNALGYASRRVPEISDDLPSIDRAMRWGFSHDLGPFELWDAIGVRATIDRIDAAPWVREMLDAGHESFYRDGAAYDPASKSYVPIAKDPRELTLQRDLGDGVLGSDAAHLAEALEELERGDWLGLVVNVDSEVTSVPVINSTKPVVAAASGRILGPAVDICFAATRIVAAAETYMGAIQPGHGACKELIRRIVSPQMNATPNADPLPFVQKALEVTAKVSTSAHEARELGFLTDSDRIVMNRDHLLHEAKQEVLALVEDRQSCLSNGYYAAGRDVRAALKATIHVLQQGGYLPAQHAAVANKLAHVLCGGDLSSGAWVSEQYLLDLEREVFA